MDQRLAAEAALGYPGLMLCGSKSAYDRAHPNNIVVFNANVCTRCHGKIWFGDLDVTKSADALKRLSETLGEDVYVLSEHDARFETENNPQFDNARAIVTPTQVNIRGAR